MPTSCLTYELSSSIDTDSLYEKLDDGYEHTGSHLHLDEELLTDVVDVEETDRGVSCVVRYDIAQQRGAREGESSWYKDLSEVRVRFTEEYFILLSSNHLGRELSNIATILDIDSDDYSRYNITTGTVANVIGIDSDKDLRGAWKNIDDYTDSASVSGRVSESTYASDFDTEGDTTYRMFESQTYGHTVGISSNKDSVAFYGNDWDNDDMEDYIFDFIL